MLKILHVTEYAKGGVATVINELLSNQNKNHKTFVLVNYSHVEYIGPTSCTYSYKGSRSFLGLSVFFIRLIYIYIKLKPDIVHLHSSFAGLVGRLALIFSSAKIVYQPHGVSFDPQRVGGIKNKIYTLIEKIFSRFTNATIAISSYEFNLICKTTDNVKVHLIENGVHDVASIQRPKERNGRLLFVGRLDYQKGFDLIINHYEKHNPDFLLDVAGEKVLNNLKTRTSSPKINYLGWLGTKELEQMYAEYSAVVMPSRWEGFGLVAIESMRAGTPVISSNRGALPSIISDNFNGFIFSIENFDSEFRDCLEKLKTKSNLFFEKNCRNSYEEKFSSEIMASKIEDLYTKILNPLT